MFPALRAIWQFLNYWYFRYLMVTELYMVERWERAVVNTIIIIVCLILSYMNYVVLSYTSSLAWPSLWTIKLLSWT